MRAILSPPSVTNSQSWIICLCTFHPSRSNAPSRNATIGRLHSAKRWQHYLHYTALHSVRILEFYEFILTLELPVVAFAHPTGTILNHLSLHISSVMIKCTIKKCDYWETPLSEEMATSVRFLEIMLLVLLFDLRFFLFGHLAYLIYILNHLSLHISFFMI